MVIWKSMKQLIIACILQILLSCLGASGLHISLAPSCTSAVAPLQCDPADEAMLLSLIASNRVSYRFMSFWSASQSCCSWPGVSCTPGRTLSISFSIRDIPINSRDFSTTMSISSSKINITLGRVTSLHTNSRDSLIRLKEGPFPNVLCNLNSLHTLSLSHASLSGPLPPCIGTRLTNLRRLTLSHNRFSGSLPASFASLHSLQFLDLSHNSLSGSIPPSFASLQSLQILSLKENQFSGSLSTIALLSNLTSLDLSRNSFTSTIPPFTSSPFLSSIKLSQNLLSGNLALFCSLSNLPSLHYLGLNTNILSQHIPPFKPLRFPSLSVLDLSYNFFNGNLPPSLYCGLTDLNVQHNALSGVLNYPSLQHSCGEHLVQLNLNNNKFTGPFPEWIASLPKLSALSLSFNFFNGTLPKLPVTVAFLQLSHNQFTGPFPPWIGSLSGMSTLDLSYNRFVGSLPASWQNLSFLTSLHLSGNVLMDPKSDAPPMSLQWLFKMPRLSRLSLRSVQLNPVHLGGDCIPLMMDVTNVEWDLSDNNLTANIFSCLVPMIMHSSHQSSSLPFLFVNISGNPLATSLDDPHVLDLLSSRVWTLDLSRCQLKGRLHHRFLARLRQHSGISRLYMSGNFLSGEIPAQLYECSRLYVLDLSHNLFTRVAPSKGSKLKGLDSLNLSNNKLAMSLSSLLSSIFSFNGTGSLYSLDLSYNLLRGPITTSPLHEKCRWLAELKLDGNHLSGTIPHELLALKVLSLAKNQLSGKLPSSFKSYLSELVLLDLSHNNLTGDLQAALFGDDTQELHNMRVLRLEHNSFTGSIPTSLGKATPALQVIDLSNNFLTGYIPKTMGDLNGFMDVLHPRSRGLTWTEVYKDGLREEPIVEVEGNVLNASMVWLDVSGNNLSGAIPKGLGELTGITYLNMSRNRLWGAIPSEVGRLKLLQYLDLSCNELEGSIPYGKFHNLSALRVFNVSYNKRLRGPLPRHGPQFQDEQSYLGDPYLYCSASPATSTLRSIVMCKLQLFLGGSFLTGL